MAATNCRYFNGYKPCGKIDSSADQSPGQCSPSCRHFDAPITRVLLIHLGALGAVVRSTALLPAIHRKYPKAHVTWVTDAPGDVLLREHPLVDRIIASHQEGLLGLSVLEFDVALVVDKSLKASGILKLTTAREVFGFHSNPRTGAIEPVTEAARELWRIGLSDHVKFHVNQKSETRLVHESLELGPWKRDAYSLHLSRAEKNETLRRRAVWSDGGRLAIVGINTGCAATIAHKKLSIEGHVRLLAEMAAAGTKHAFVLLGGREDTARNQTIAARGRARGLTIVESTTDQGLRDGMMSLAACDIVVSGDSLGMHMALGFGKPVVAWFGPTCAHEIDLYGGSAVITTAACSPCWKRSCDKPVMCYDQIDFRRMATEVMRLSSASTYDHLGNAADRDSSDGVFG